MNKDKKNEDFESSISLQVLIEEMLANFVPTTPDDPDMIMYTSEEFREKMESTIDVSITDISLMLQQRNFHLQPTTEGWAWVMKKKS